MDYGKLIWTTPDGAQHTWELQRGANTLGRDDGNDIVLDSSVVSGLHAIINCQDTGSDIIDSKSLHGTYLNEHELKRGEAYPLRHNDLIAIQPFTLRFDHPPPPPEPPRPPRPDPHMLVLNDGRRVIGPVEAARRWQYHKLPLITADYPIEARPRTLMYPLRHAPSSYLRYLPPIYHDSDLMNVILLACESILDPIERMIEQIDGYFSPWTTPQVLLPWLASWVDVVLDERVPLDRQRALVAAAADLYRRRGTRAGLRDYLQLYLGVEPTIIEPGDERGTPDDPALPADCFRVIIPLRENQVDLAALRAIIEAEKPAHTSYDLRLRGTDEKPST